MDNAITFFLQEQELSFQLVNEDPFTWRNILRRYLNQIGFHEQFKPIKKIGKGNFASVYLAEKFEDGRKYAVKAFSKEAAYSEENGKECLVKEVEIMRNLNSRNNMKLCEVFESDNSLYIIFELLEGGQLFEKIKVIASLSSPRRSSGPHRSNSWSTASSRGSGKCTPRTSCTATSSLRIFCSGAAIATSA